MTIIDVLKQGAEAANVDEIAQEMLADFKDHKVGIKLDNDDVTLVVADSKVSLESGIRDDCHAVMKLKNEVMCGAIDNSVDLMEIKDQGEIIKGDMTDPDLPVHFMATFPFFDTMVRLYESDETFKKQVDEVKAAL